MPTTSNFGWTTPADTDLVKDGALAIRTLGNAIDTSMAELKGGTTGQVLSKTSNTDMDFTWVTQDDANAIQNAIVDAKGDLIAATANDTPARLAVGSNGETLVADSAATTGLRYTSGVGLTQPVINGAFDLWQRGTTLTPAGSWDKTFLADRFWMYRATAGNGTTSRQSSGAPEGFQYYFRFQRTAGTTTTNTFILAQDIETANSINYAGKTVTLSFYARAGANYSATSNNLVVELQSGTGTDQSTYSGFTGGAFVVNSNAVLTTTWQRFTFTGNVASNATELGFLIRYNPTGTAGAADLFDITGVQIDVGQTALPFRRSGGTIQGELAACQRYYWRWTTTGSSYGNLVGGFAETANNTNAVLRFPVTMRANPSTSLEIGGTLQVYDSGFVTGGTWSSNNPTTNSIVIVYSKTGGFTQYRPYVVLANNDATTYLGVSAEL